MIGYHPEGQARRAIRRRKDDTRCCRQRWIPSISYPEIPDNCLRTRKPPGIPDSRLPASARGFAFVGAGPKRLTENSVLPSTVRQDDVQARVAGWEQGRLPAEQARSGQGRIVAPSGIQQHTSKQATSKCLQPTTDALFTAHGCSVALAGAADGGCPCSPHRDRSPCIQFGAPNLAQPKPCACSLLTQCIKTHYFHTVAQEQSAGRRCYQHHPPG